jgi:hypothetical protein
VGGTFFFLWSLLDGFSRFIVHREIRPNIAEYVRRYNEVRLHGAIGYVTPADKLAGRDKEIFAE